MAYTLDDLAEVLADEASMGPGAFGPEQLHRALRSAGEHFLAETHAVTAAASVSVGSGVTSIDVTAAVAGFVRDDLVGKEAYIDHQPVKLVGYQQVARYLQGTPATGRPTRMGFLTDDALYFDRETDQAYTLVLPHAARLTTITPGTTSNPTLNLPHADAPRVAETGGVWYLLKGEHDQNGLVQQAYQGFMQLIEQARSRYPDTAAQQRDRNTKN